MNQLLHERLKDIGRIKLAKRVDPLNSHKYKMLRGGGRKTLRQVPKSQEDGVKGPLLTPQLGDFIRNLDVSNKAVDVAKKAPSGVWRISKSQVLDIAKKYKFNIPAAEKPMKHLGSTGIQMIRYKPGVYYLYKPRKRHRKTRAKSIKKAMTNFNMGMNQ